MILAGYHILKDSWQDSQKKEIIHKYIYLSNNWEEIKKFFFEGLTNNAHFYFYYSVKLDEPFDLTNFTYQFNLTTKNKHLFLQSLGIAPPNNINQDEASTYYLYCNDVSHMIMITKRSPQIITDEMEIHKKQIHENTMDNLKVAFHEIVTYRDFYLIENIVRTHTMQMDRLDIKDIKMPLNKTICLNILSGYHFL